jgi:hypothetical protein
MAYWVDELDKLAASWPACGSRALAQAMRMWLWTLEHLQANKDDDGKKLFNSNRHGVTFPMADALAWLVAARCFIMDVVELKKKGPENPVVAEGLDGLLSFYADLTRIHSARTAGEIARICGELVYGYTRSSNSQAADMFELLRQQLDTALVGARFARDRAGEALAGVMIPEALDYPM